MTTKVTFKKVVSCDMDMPDKITITLPNGDMVCSEICYTDGLFSKCISYPFVTKQDSFGRPLAIYNIVIDTRSFTDNAYYSYLEYIDCSKLNGTVCDIISSARGEFIDDYVAPLDDIVESIYRLIDVIKEYEEEGVWEKD